MSAEVPPASRHTGKRESSRAEEWRDPLEFSNPENGPLALLDGTPEAEELEKMSTLARQNADELIDEIRKEIGKPGSKNELPEALRDSDLVNTLRNHTVDYNSFAGSSGVHISTVKQMRDGLAELYRRQGKEFTPVLERLGARHYRSDEQVRTSPQESKSEEGRAGISQEEKVVVTDSAPDRRPVTKGGVKTPRPGQKGPRVGQKGSATTIRSLQDLGPAIDAAQKARNSEPAPEQEKKPEVVQPVSAEETQESSESAKPKAPEKAAVLPEDATKAETKEQLKTSVSRLQEFAEKAGFGAERTAMLEAEKAYLAKHREFYAKNDVLERLLKRSVGRTGFRGGSNDIAELKELKQKYDEARISYDNAIRGKTFDTLLPGNEKMDARLVDKYVRLKREGKLERTPTGREIDIEEFKKQALEKRAERSTYHIRAKEVLNRARLQVDAKAEGLNDKGLELWDRVPNLLAKGNAALEKKFGKNGARVVKALGATSFVLGGMAVGALGGAAVLSVGALLGVGGATFGRKLLASTLIGPAARAAARVVYDRTRGKQLVKEARGELGRMDKDKGLLTPKRLAAYDTKRIKLSEKASGEYQKRERGLIEFAVTFVAGGGAATALFNEEAVDRALDSMPPEVRHEVEVEARQIGAAIERAAEQAEQPTVDAIERTAGGASAASEASQLAERAWHAEPLTVTLDRLEGADHLFSDMRSQLLDQYPDEATRPPAVEHILEANHPNALSREFGFAEGERSLVMYEGDSFSITEEGQLVFVREGQEPMVLLEANGEKPEGFVDVNDRAEFKEMPSTTSTGSVEPPSVPDVEPASIAQEDQPLPEADSVDESEVASPSSLTTDSLPDTVGEQDDVITTPPGQSLEEFVRPQDEAPEVPSDQPVEESLRPAGVPGTSLEDFTKDPAETTGQTKDLDPKSNPLEDVVKAIPQSPAVFDSYPHESFTNSYDQAIDPARPGVYQNADGTAFVFGGDYAGMRQAAEAFAREHPGTLVTLEDRPHMNESGQVERSAARLLSDERGRIITATYKENPALVDQLPNPYTFVSRIR